MESTWETSSAPPKEGLLHEFPEERHEAAQVLGYFRIEKAPEKWGDTNGQAK